MPQSRRSPSDPKGIAYATHQPQWNKINKSLAPTNKPGLLIVVEATDDVCGSILRAFIPQDSHTTVINSLTKAFCGISAPDSTIKCSQLPAQEL